MFLAHLGDHQTEPVFTDGSKMDQQVGFAARFPNYVRSGRLTNEASIFTAEMYAVRLALKDIISNNNQGNSFTIFSDSQSAILALKPNVRASPLAEEIIRTLKTG